MEKAPKDLPDQSIRVWIGIGIASIIFVLLIPALFVAAFEAERNRYVECVSHTRTDCDPSVIWSVTQWPPPVAPSR